MAPARRYPFRLWWGVAACLIFMAVIGLVGPYSAHFTFLPDKGFSWYYWQLPEATTLGFVSAWLGYALHQFGSWWLIARAKRQRPAYTNGLHTINLQAMVFNGLCVLLHIVQTKLWYDGTAQTVSVWSSQFAVIFLLSVVLLMETPRRGLFFGKPVPFSKRALAFLKKYHGYYFSWAVIYTFWYHPIELTEGHLLGTFYVLLLMLQGSLFFTRFHRNRLWTTTLEVYVLFHGAVVAYLSPMQSANTVAMFAFGFFTLFMVTQIHGLGLARRWLWLFGVGYLAAVAFYYWPNPMGVTTVLRVPLILYGFAFLILALVWLGFWGHDALKRRRLV